MLKQKHNSDINVKTDYKKSDKLIYDMELKDFLPEKIFDAHIHIFDKSCLKPDHEFPPKSCYRKFGGKFSFENCSAYFDRLLAGKEVFINHFGQPSMESDLDASARYTGKKSDNKKYFGMALVSPHDELAAVQKRVTANRLVGYKPYLNFVDWKAKDEITLFDMLPAGQMEYANETGLAVTLHIPRSGRLADPVNQQQMVELCRRYPNAKIIFAHIGRAYYLKNIVGCLDGIARCPNACIDTAMVNHEGVLEYAFRKFPRDRILFASDAPIAFLHGKSVEINNQYAYLMAEDYRIGTAIYDLEKAVEFTFFYYEQLRALKLAGERAGLSRSEIENIFFNNAFNLFKNIAETNYGGNE
ncbi:MAG: amidohydrolase family protein [Victivallales bacterium]